MNPEDKFFIVASSDGRLNVRSSAKVENGNDLGNFDLLNNDVIHVSSVEIFESSYTFHKFDRIYRNGTRYDFPFKSFPAYIASPTNTYWVAEKAGTEVLMQETTNPEIPGKKYVGWRVLHKAEGGYQNTPQGMPEVIPPVDQVGLSMTKEIQQMSFDLMKHFNSAITPKLWTAVHYGHVAFTNHQGFGDHPKGGGPRANYITGDDLDKELPKYDKMGRICGGMFVRGVEKVGKLVCQPGIHGIDAKKPLPTIQTIIDNKWYFFAVVFQPKRVEHFPQGQGNPVAIPFIFDREVQFPISLFEPWESDTLPDSLTIYKK